MYVAIAAKMMMNLNMTKARKLSVCLAYTESDVANINLYITK